MRRWRCSNATSSSARSRPSPPAGSCSCAARPGSARPRWCASSARGRERVLWGACDALFTPRPLGPFADVAEAAGGAPRARARRRAAGRAARPAARRAGAAVACSCWRTCTGPTRERSTCCACSAAGSTGCPRSSIGTYRDDELDAAHRCASRSASCTRTGCGWRRCPSAAVRAARRAEDGRARCTRSPAATRSTSPRRWRRGEALPATVRDAVLGRAARLEPRPAARLLEPWRSCPAAPSPRCSPAPTSDRRVPALRGAARRRARPSRSATSWRGSRSRTRSRRAAGRRCTARRWRALEAARRRPRAARPPRRGGRRRRGRAAPRARRRRARGPRCGAHREAAAQYARALRCAGGCRRASAPSCWSAARYECYLTDQIEEAIEARLEALALQRELGDRLREGDALRWLSRLHWFARPQRRGRALRRRGGGAARAARARPRAGDGLQQPRAAGDARRRRRGARRWGSPRSSWPRRSATRRRWSHALNNVGTAEAARGLPEGGAKLERSLAMAREHGLEEHVARAYCNLDLDPRAPARAGWPAGADRRGPRLLPDARPRLVALYIASWQARRRAGAGGWDAAADAAGEVLRDPAVSPISRISALVALAACARGAATRGAELLEEARELAAPRGELQRLVPAEIGARRARVAGGEDARAGRRRCGSGARRRTSGRSASWPLAARRRAASRRAGRARPSRTRSSSPGRMEDAAARGTRAAACTPRRWRGATRPGSRASAPAPTVRRLGPPRAAGATNVAGLPRASSRCSGWSARGCRTRRSRSGSCSRRRTVDHHVSGDPAQARRADPRRAPPPRPTASASRR